MTGRLYTSSRLPALRPVEVFVDTTSVRVKAPFHLLFNKAARKLGGRFTNHAWEFPPSVEPQVRKLLQKYFGTGDPSAVPDQITIRIRAKQNLVAHIAGVTFASRIIASARGLETGAQPGLNVSMLSGEIGSRGSMRNWYTFIDEGSEFEVRGILPEMAVGNDKFEIIPAEDVDPLAAAEAAHARMLAWLAEMDAEIEKLRKNA